MNKRLLNTASAAPFMGFYGDGGTTVLMPHMRNRMTFAPEDGTGNAGGEDNTQSGQERMRQAMLAEEAKKKAAEEAAAAAKAGKTGKETPPNDDTPPEEAKHLREVMKWKTKAREAEERLQAFEGLDAAEIRELVAKSKEAEEERLKAEQAAEEQRARAAGEFDKLKESMAKEHAKAMKKLQDELKERDTKEATLSKKINDLTVGSAFTNSSFVRSNLTLPPTKARIIYGSYFDLDDQGRVVGYDKPKGAEGRSVLVDASGDPLPFDEAFKQIVEADPDKDDILRSTVQSGTGSRPAPGAATSKAAPKLSGTSRIAAALKAQAKK